jgi:hypothetical protein
MQVAYTPAVAIKTTPAPVFGASPRTSFSWGSLAFFTTLCAVALAV